MHCFETACSSTKVQRSWVVTLVNPSKQELSIGYPPLLHAKHLTYPVLFGRGHPHVDGATHIDLLRSQLMVPPTATCATVRHSVTQPKLQDIPGEHAQGWEGERPGITPFVLRVGQFHSSHFWLTSLSQNGMRCTSMLTTRDK